MKQLTLDVILPAKPRELHPSILQVLAKAKLENVQATAIAKEMYGDNVGDLAKLPKLQYIAVWKEFHRRAGTQSKPLREQTLQPRKVSLYKPWTAKRKQQTRTSRLKTKLLKKFSFPNLWIEAIQNEITQKPHYYGVCPLPGSIDHCSLSLIDHLPNKAKEKEIALRKAEHQQYLDSIK